MRNFFIASATAKVATDSSTHKKVLNALTDLADGQVAFSACETPATAIDAGLTGLAAMKKLQLLFGNTDVTGQHRWESFPFFANHLSYSKMAYKAATRFAATLTVNAPTTSGPYSLIIVKKGVQFNERNKWTEDVYIPANGTMTAATLLSKLADAINENSASSGVTATITQSTMSIMASEVGVDYEIVAADELRDVATVTIVTPGIPGEADKAMVIDLANKAIADRGINDTYTEAGEYMHPRYPITRGAASLSDKYDILTIRFAEPRLVKTRDEVVHQIIQIAFPKVGAAENPQVKYVTDILDALGAVVVA